jgi:hypothetical protein
VKAHVTSSAPAGHRAPADADPDLSMVHFAHFPARLPLHADLFGIRGRCTDSTWAAEGLAFDHAASASLPSGEMVGRSLRLRPRATA